MIYGLVIFIGILVYRIKFFRELFLNKIKLKIEKLQNVSN